MKTKPERQYDFFVVEGQDPKLPQGAVWMTEYDINVSGRWACQYTATNYNPNATNASGGPGGPNW